ncbi:MAG TPA: pyridoxal phosphate-dependent aminotransferase [Thermoanaerobaculia bacterium]|nr:pyridoxal phosphate-dependent aminotransferase [Thermoanaerobaculia bacterium]HUM30402.1 pyridoxal phosphate-dependent aminotransferase [Thermoanaerobaculia bacterium]HXK68587.1 pyridoxal phosphate-dependent aminotransferase [Thermoanaerobaculia bacterium]
MMEIPPRPKGSLISHFSRMAIRHGGVNLAQGRPGFSPPEELVTSLREILREPDVHQYAPGNGDFDLLESIAGLYKSPVPLTPDHVLVVNGATEAMSLIFLMLASDPARKGAVLSFSPLYESYPKLGSIFSRPFIEVPVDPDTLAIDLDRVEDLVVRHEVKIILVASPGNPLGRIWTREEWSRLREISLQHDVHVLHDAVYEAIYFREPPRPTIDPEFPGHLFISAFSKTLCITGWRIGYIIADADTMERLRAVHDYTGLSSPYLLQRAIARYLALPRALKTFTRDLRVRCRHSFTRLKNGLSELGFRVSPAEGGMFLWARLPEGYDDGYEFAVRLFEASKVAVVPGENFMASPSPYIRLNIAQELPTIDEALDRMGEFITHIYR